MIGTTLLVLLTAALAVRTAVSFLTWRNTLREMRDSLKEPSVGPYVDYMDRAVPDLLEADLRAEFKALEDREARRVARPVVPGRAVLAGGKPPAFATPLERDFAFLEITRQDRAEREALKRTAERALKSTLPDPDGRRPGWSL